MMFCWFHRLMISHAADGNRQLSGIVKKHIRHCANCREFYETCLSLGEDLARQAAISNREVSKRLSKRILMAVPRSGAVIEKVGIKVWPLVAAACVALIVVIGALYLVTQRHDQGDGQPDKIEMAAAIQELRAAYKLVGKDLTAAWPGVIEEPLASEFKNLTDDTASAVRFLAACVAVNVTGPETKSVN